MNLHVEEALLRCGRDRVMHRHPIKGVPTWGVAIRALTTDELSRRIAGTAVGSFVATVIGEGASLDAAGIEAATKYVAQLRSIANSLRLLSEQLKFEAQHIESACEKGGPR